MCVDTGPSVCLSSITNILAFLVGSLNATPEIQLFNIVNAIALTVDLIYSLTLYTAILSLYAENEQKEMTVKENEWTLKIHTKVSKLLDVYVEFVSNTWISISIILGLLVFWVFSFNGALQMDVNLRSEKFFLKDSKLLKVNLIYLWQNTCLLA